MEKVRAQNRTTFGGVVNNRSTSNDFSVGNYDSNEKTMVLTVLSSMKLYFGEKNGTHT